MTDNYSFMIGAGQSVTNSWIEIQGADMASANLAAPLSESSFLMSLVTHESNECPVKDLHP